MRTSHLALLATAVLAVHGCSDSDPTQPPTADAAAEAHPDDRVDATTEAAAPTGEVDARADTSDGDAAPCTGPNPGCSLVFGDGLCSDVNGPDPVCSGGTWSCPTGSIPFAQCRCGVPPHCDAGATKPDAAADAEVVCTGTRPGCFNANASGICSDVGGPQPVCSGGTWSCPTGSLPLAQCRCGVPPRGDCLREAGADATAE